MGELATNGQAGSAQYKSYLLEGAQGFEATYTFATGLRPAAFTTT